MTKVTRKAIISAISANDAIFNEVMAAVETDKETLKAVLDKWTVALNKTTTKKADEARETMINDIVAFINQSDAPVTAKTINDKFVHAERTNKASALLRQAVENCMISRNKVRKNANFEYASMDFDWDEYISAYDEKMTEKAKARIARAHENRTK